MGLTETLKDVVNLVQKLDNIELHRKILDLQTEALGLVQDKISLTEQVRELTEQLQVRDALVPREDGYWRELENGKEDGPFCTACWDADGKLIRQIKTNGLDACPVCHTIRTKGGASQLTLSKAKLALRTQTQR